jgi:tRNA A-37 threonylcarbamoyl transferase component Bud32
MINTTLHNTTRTTKKRTAQIPHKKQRQNRGSKAPSHHITSHSISNHVMTITSLHFIGFVITANTNYVEQRTVDLTLSSPAVQQPVMRTKKMTMETMQMATQEQDEEKDVKERRIHSIHREHDSSRMD